MPGNDATTAVLLMALGGPSSLEEVGPYLSAVRGGRPTPERMVEEFRERYRRIGGRSPLLDVTQAQARALETLLRSERPHVRTFVGMRHWHPFLQEALERVVAEGIQRVVGLPLTPYQSPLSFGAYVTAAREAAQRVSGGLELEFVESWNDAPSLTQAFATKVTEGRAALAERGFADPYVLFTAHSLPVRPPAGGDPYEREIRETMDLTRARLPPLRASLAFQSAGRTDDPWLGPPMQEVVRELPAKGEKAVLVAPIGFVSDNLEILYDLDLELRPEAEKWGLAFERTRSLNDDPLLVEAMASAVRPFLPG